MCYYSYSLSLLFVLCFSYIMGGPAQDFFLNFLPSVINMQSITFTRISSFTQSINPSNSISSFVFLSLLLRLSAYSSFFKQHNFHPSALHALATLKFSILAQVILSSVVTPHIHLYIWISISVACMYSFFTLFTLFYLYEIKLLLFLWDYYYFIIYCDEFF